jgi:hypothetical protein
MTPEQEEQVRRALASLPAEPMPEEVAARLEARLGQLQAERAADGDPVEKPADRPTSITGPSGDPARRNRRWPTVLVAAALLAVVGVGVGNVLDDVTGGAGPDGMTAESGGEAAEEPPRTLDQGPREAELPPAQESHAGATSMVAGRMVHTAKRVALHSKTLDHDVSAFMAVRLPRAAANEEMRSQSADKAAEARRLARLFTPCQLPRTRPGDQLVAVRLDGDPATLVLHEPADGTRVAEVHSCGDASDVVAVTNVPAR